MSSMCTPPQHTLPLSLSHTHTHTLWMQRVGGASAEALTGVPEQPTWDGLKALGAMGFKVRGRGIDRCGRVGRGHGMGTLTHARAH